MRQARFTSSRLGRGQGGFTLLELLLSSMIGLFALGATFVAFQGTVQLNRASTAQAQMSEDAALAFSQLRTFIAQADYSAPITGSVSGGFTRVWNQRAIFGCDNGFGSLNTSPDTQACSTATSGPDTIAVAFQADASNSLVNASGVPLDCLGNPTVQVGTGTAAYYVSFNRFFIASRQLYCRGYDSSSPQALVDNVEDMVISYGVSTAKDGNVNYYTNASSITDWKTVVTVRVCLVMRSADAVLSEATPYQGCDPFASPTTPSDRNLYRAYTMTVGLRNRMGVET